MASSRLDAIKNEKRIADAGGTSSRKTYVKEDFLAAIDMKRWTPGKGHNFISIVPPKREGFFGERLHVHFNVGPSNDAFLCPQEMKRMRCPICEYREKLKEDPEANQDAVRNLYPTIRYLFFIIDSKSGDTKKEGVQLYDAAFSVQKGIMGVSVNKRTGEVIDVSDPKEGKVVSFDRTGMGPKDTKYVSFELEDRPPLPSDIFDTIPDFDELIEYADYDEISSSFFGSAPQAEERKSADTRESAAPSTHDTAPWDPPAPEAKAEEAPKPEAPKSEAPKSESTKTEPPASTSEAKAKSLADIRAKLAERLRPSK